MTKVTGSQLALSAFPRDGRCWQIVAHGRVRAPTEVDESTCEVFLAEAGWDKPSRTPPPTIDTRSIWLGVGQLPLTPVGSSWQDGVCIATSNRRQSRIEVVGASKKWPAGQLGKTVAYQRSPTAPWAPAYPIGHGGDTPLFRIVTSDGGALWVPALEVARATFCTTSQWLRLMIEGGMHVWPQLRGRIIDPSRSVRHHDDPKTLKVWAYRGLDELDVLAAARICADKALRLSFDGVAEGLRRNGVGRAPAHVIMPFPFQRPSTWTIEECWTASVLTDGQLMRPRRLVTRILDIEYDLGLERIRVYHPGVADADEDSEAHEPGSQRLRLRAKGDVSGNVRVMTGQASWSALGVMKKPSAYGRANGSWTVEHFPVEPEEPVAGRAKVVSVDGLIQEATTAGHGTKSERGGRLAIKLNLKDKMQTKMDIARPPLARMASTITALEELAINLGRELHVVRPRDQPGNDPVDGLWRYPIDEGSRTLRWATTREGRQRRALVARLQAEGRWFYFLEAEHLEIGAEEASGAPNIIGQDGYSALCVLAIQGEDLLSADMISDFLRVNAAARGVWRRLSLAIPMTTVRRANAWLHDYSSYSRAIGRAVRRLESGPAQSDLA